MLTEDMMKSDKYICLIERKVIPDMRWGFPDFGEIFQQDLVPCLSFKKSEDDIQETQIKCARFRGVVLKKRCGNVVPKRSHPTRHLI